MNFSNFYLLFFVLILFCGLLYSKNLSVYLSETEKKILYREMVLYDISLRNAISAFSLKDKKNSLKAYETMSNFISLKNPKLKENTLYIIKKLKKNNTFQHIKNIQRYSNRNIKHIKSTGKKNKLNWNYIINNLVLISKNCKNCHTKLNIIGK